MRGRGRGPQHAATRGVREAAAESQAESKAKAKPPAEKSLVEPVLRALGAKTTRLASLRALMADGLTVREVMAVAFAELYAILDLPTTGKDAVDPIRQRIQVGKSLELLARLAEADKERAPRDVRLHVTVGGAGGAGDSAGNGPVQREDFLAKARARGFEFDPPRAAEAE